MRTYRVLDIDLPSRKVRTRRFDEDLTRAFLGGGLAAGVLHGETFPQTDPLSPDSIVCLFNGLLTGTGVPSASKLTLCARSPLTGIWGESTVGGHWPARMTGTGFDGLMLTGKAEAPVVVRLDEEGAHLEDAVELWGMDTFDAADELERRYPKHAVASIGPAGERRLPIAGVMIDGRIARAAARGGLGAVLGSKNVKAVIGRGEKKAHVADRDSLRAMVREDVRRIVESAGRLREFGTSGGLEGAEMTGDLPVGNWRLGRWREGAKKTTAQAFFPKYLAKHHTCDRCPIRCGKLLRQEIGRYAGSVSHGPEYETLAGFGGNCLVEEPEAVMQANECCNRMGLDTISASNVIAFAMEAYERGLISREEAGYEIRWGDGEVLLRLLDDMVEGRGVGKLLAKGVRAAARELNGDAPNFAVHVKGMELPLHDPRAFTSMAANYALASRGGCHLDAMSYMTERGLRLDDYGYQGELEPSSHEHKAQVAYENMKYLSMFNPLGLCKFLFIGQAGPTMIARWTRAVTGWDVSADELLEAGERLITVKRLYNLARGVTCADDVLPPRLHQPRPDGAAAGVVPDYLPMVRQIYQWRGWDEKGVPTPETLERLGIKP